MRTDFLKILVSYIAIGLLILFAGRLMLFMLFLNTEEIMNSSSCFGLALYNILRFDLQTLAYVAILPTILFCAGSFAKIRAIEKIVKWYYTVVYTIIVILILVDLGFYRNFGEHLNVTLFDFLNEGPLSLIQAFWEEYPVILILLAIVFVFVILAKLKINYAIGTKNYVMLIVWLIFIVISMRGSITEFPLQVEDINVSSSKQLNACVPNAVYSLKKAIKEKKTAFQIEPERTILNRWGFNTTDEAWNAFGKESRNLYDKAIGFDNKTQKQPDVVIILSESWSGYLCHLGLKNTDADLLCGMRKHFNEDLLFSNYQSVQNGTIASIENLTISTSYPRVFMSKHRYNHFETSFARPFLKSGYQTVFMSGMEKGWENVGVGIENQGFETIFKYDLLAKHPEYHYNSIGVYDHHVMNSLIEYLNKPSNKPRLFIVMTTTNHPPFVYPEEVELPEISEAIYNTPAFANKRDIQEKYLRGFQYANLSLGRFMDKLKKSSSAKNTIVMITGDHNVRTALAYGNGKVDKRWEYAVPLYIYLPEELRGTDDGTYKCDTNKYGSHYDILPTLATLTLRKGVQYLNIGQDLLSDSLNRYNTYSYNVESTLADKSCVFNAKKKANARECLLRLYIQKVMFGNE